MGHDRNLRLSFASIIAAVVVVFPPTQLPSLWALLQYRLGIHSRFAQDPSWSVPSTRPCTCYLHTWSIFYTFLSPSACSGRGRRLSDNTSCLDILRLGILRLGILRFDLLSQYTSSRYTSVRCLICLQCSQQADLENC
jgi:hypothetical protein